MLGNMWDKCKRDKIQWQSTAFGAADWIPWSVGDSLDLLEVCRNVVIQQHDAPSCRDRVPRSVPEVTHLQEYEQWGRLIISTGQLSGLIFRISWLFSVRLQMIKKRYFGSDATSSHTMSRPQYHVVGNTNIHFTANESVPNIGYQFPWFLIIDLSISPEKATSVDPW